MSWPKIVYNEEVMRKGFGIEDVAIPLEAKVKFLDALSETGLKRITVGAIVSPRLCLKWPASRSCCKDFTRSPVLPICPSFTMRRPESSPNTIRRR